MDDDQQFCLRWNNHQSTLISVFDTLLENETLVDCTLAAEGKFLKAHKVVLSACSPYFATLLQEQYDKHPIFILKDVKYQELRAMMDYMYRGEVNISQDQLAALLKAAESLQIKGLSDSRTSGSAPVVPNPIHHRAAMPTAKLSAGYTLEQTKRARIAGPAEPEMGSREGSSSPSRRRRKVRRRSIENAMADVHDNSNSSQHLQQSQANTSGLGAITAAASALAAAAAAAAPSTQSLASNVPLSASTSSSTAVTTTGTTLSSSKKTDNVKGTTQQQQTQQQQHDAMNIENAQGPASATTATGSLDTETTDGAATAAAADKSNHKQQMQQQHKQAKDSLNAGGAAASSSTELVIEPKAEYDDEANDEPVEDLTLDEEDMGMDDLDQNAGTSQGGEGSSQGYAPWQHDRSQDELLLATQEAQQRDPQDLTNKFQQIHKENTAPNQVLQIQKINSRTILNTNDLKRANFRNSLLNHATTSATIDAAKPKSPKPRLSMAEVSDMFYEFYRNNAVAKAPKFRIAQQQHVPMATAATAAVAKYVSQTSPTSAETHEPSSIAAIATNSAAFDTASKNVPSDEMMASKMAASFHRRYPYADSNHKVPSPNKLTETVLPINTAIPTSVVVPAKIPLTDSVDIKPLINPRTGLIITPHASVIKPVPVANPMPSQEAAAAIAAAFICDNYQNFHEQFRKFKDNESHKNETAPAATNILETFLRQQKYRNNDTASDNDTADDEEDSRYNGFEDIHLVEGNRTQYPPLMPNVMANTSSPGTSRSADYYNEEPQKYLNLAAQAQAQALRNLDYSFGDYNNPNTNDNSNSGPTGFGLDGEPVYECRHCGKKYRWKSTLRRHENVECGGKEPSHKCPYCAYKSKQRGNLGVHVRKHHADLPQLESKRRSKYSVKFEQNSSVKLESNSNCTNASDDSNNKLVIDCSK